MTEWSLDAARKYMEQHTTDGMLEAKAQREQNVLKTQAFDLWKSLADLFEANCRDFNQDVKQVNLLRFQRTSGGSFLVSRKDTARLLEAEFDDQRNLVRINGHDGFGLHGQYKIGVKPGTSEPYFCSSDGHPIPAEIIMRTTLNALLDIV
ncbi:MAG TPA: hypothetical protein VKY85_23280 [Candidatus Angelobacter sp.]|nr:hypothetical protein [Candidatus Angelobacter sp.]